MIPTRWIKGLIVFAIGVILLADLVLVVPGIGFVGMLPLYAVGRHGNCDRMSALRGVETLRRREAAIERNHAAAEKLRDDGAVTLWRTSQGEFWVPSRDKTGFVPLLAEQEMRVYGKVRPGEIVIDAGANIGDFTRAALEDGAKLVVAIEVNPVTLDALRRNLAAEIARGRVIVYTKGVWDSDAELTLQVGPASGVDSVIPRVGFHASTVVQLTTIDKIVAELSLPRVDFMKLDVEGAEIPAVRGAREVIRQFKPRMAFDAEEFTSEAHRTLEQELRSLDPGYRRLPCLCVFIPSQWRLRTEVVSFEVPTSTPGPAR